MKNDTLLVSLPDVIQKNQIIEESRAVRKELTDSTISVFKNAEGLFPATGLPDETQVLQSTYEKLSGRKTPIIDDIGRAVTRLNSNLDTLEAYIDKNINDNIVKSNISLKELNLIQLIGITGFVSTYARYLLSYFYTVESSKRHSSSIVLDETFTKADVKWIKDNFLDFINALGSLSIENGQLEKILNQIPEIRVNPSNVRAVLATQNNSKVDPLKMQFLNVTNWFGYRLLQMWGEYQADRYKIALEEKRMLEHRNLLLKRQRDGKPDARLEKEITIMENRISKLTYKIRKMEQIYD